MQSFEEIRGILEEKIECRFLAEDMLHWTNIVASCKCAFLPYKAAFLEYQATYFTDVYEMYEDVSLVIYRGGHPVGIWPLCVYVENGMLQLGTVGGAIFPPLLPGLVKAEAQRAIFEKCIQALFIIAQKNSIQEIQFLQTVMEDGISLWTKKLMEHGAVCNKITHRLFTDLSLSHQEIQSRIRRTNKYSIAKGECDYDIFVYDETFDHIDEIFQEFHAMHVKISGRETRSAKTWEIQEKSVNEGSQNTGHSFVVFIRDKKTQILAGAALFDATPSCSLYCVAAYDRDRFSKPVGHMSFAIT